MNKPKIRIIFGKGLGARLKYEVLKFVTAKRKYNKFQYAIACWARTEAKAKSCIDINFYNRDNKLLFGSRLWTKDIFNRILGIGG